MLMTSRSKNDSITQSCTYTLHIHYSVAKINEMTRESDKTRIHNHTHIQKSAAEINEKSVR